MFYKQYVAQYASANLRVPLEVHASAEGSVGSATPRTAKRHVDCQEDVVQATHTTSSDVVRGSVPRVAQNKTSKIVLQSLLAFMFVCAASELSFNTYRGIVLWNSCTVMGLMMPFAGSRCTVHGGEEGQHSDR